MVSSVNAFLGFDKGSLPPNEFMVIGQSEQSGSFVLHHVINGLLKFDRAVCLASLVQKFHHYNTISQKIGNSLQAAKDAEKFSFFDGLSFISEALLPSNPKSGKSLGRKTLLKNFIEELLKSLAEVAEDGSNPPVLVIDDLSVLLSLGFSVDDVCQAVDEIRSVSLLNPSQWKGLSVVVLCTYNKADRDSRVLQSQLAESSSITVDVRGLETGYCKDVHGQARVTWRKGVLRPRRQWTRTQQFKVQENGAEFFAKGTSTAVL